MRSWQKLISNVFIIAVILYSYWGIWNIFFQQDEWLGLGGAIYRQETFGTLGSIAQVFNFQNVNESLRFLPITSISNHLLYSNFGINIPIYGLLALTIVAICALIFNQIVYKLTSSYLLSIMSSILWVTNNLAYQAFTWIATMMPSLLTTLFFLSSLYLLLIYNERKKNFYLISSILLMVLSLFSKESSVYYIVTYSAIIWFFFKRKFAAREKLKLTALFVIPLTISLILPRIISLSFHQNNFFPSINSADQTETIYNFFLIPARSLFHIYFSQPEIYEFIYAANKIHYSSQTNGYVVESIIADAFSLLAAFYFLLAFFVVALFAKVKDRKVMCLSLVSFFASTLPFIIFKNDAAILETRFYIFPAIWAALLLSQFVYVLFSRIPKARNLLMFLVFIPVVFYNILGTHKHLRQDILTGQYRNGILDTISEVRPALGNNNVFYLYTENNGFYEFQSGFGQTLAVWLYDTGKISKETLIDRNYWDLSYEGIKTYPRGKFGYFMTYVKLRQGLKDNPDITINQVFSFYWDPQKHSVKNVTEEIREKLKKDTSNEKISHQI